MKSYWQIRDAEGHILADFMTWPVACDVLSVFQHHNITVSLRQVGGAA